MWRTGHFYEYDDDDDVDEDEDDDRLGSDGESLSDIFNYRGVHRRRLGYDIINSKSKNLYYNFFYLFYK